MQTRQDLDLLAECFGQRRRGLLGTDNVGGVDGVVVVAGELVGQLLGLPLAFLAETRTGNVGVDHIAGVGQGLGVPDER